jgi:hypothetical protein
MATQITPPAVTTPPLPRLKKMVEQILAENPKYRGIDARNSDIALTILIWQRWYGVSVAQDGSVPLHRLLDLPREDNVKRVRAKYQNEEHKYLPTNPDVLVKRGIAEDYWRDALGYNLTKDEWARHYRTQAELKVGEQALLV